ncbi:MAG: trimeric intracellular cation channel family protein, partial [Dehalococcoidia bacterium]
MDGTVRDVIETIGILSFAVTGMIVAQKAGVNPAGTYLVALFAGMGGGTLRDVMLDVRPFLWEKQPLYPVVIFLLSLGYVFWSRAHAFLSQPKHIVFATIEVVAAASLGIAGAVKADSLGQQWLMVVIYGVISGSFGGVARDMLVNEMPLLFRVGEWLAGALLIGCLVLVGLEAAGASAYLSSGIGAALIIGIRLTAVLRQRHQHLIP